MDISNPKQIFTRQLIDTNVNSTWSLYKCGFKRSPIWSSVANDTTKLCFYREICYLNINKQVFGLGRSWTPINWKGFLIIIKSTFCAKPIGIVFTESINEEPKYKIVGNLTYRKTFWPFWTEKIKCKSFRRILIYQTKNPKKKEISLIVEEDFIEE